MALFSERYGYIKPSDVIIREAITPAIANAICSCYDGLEDKTSGFYDVGNDYALLEEHLWRVVLAQRKGDFWKNGVCKIVATSYILDKDKLWFEKLDLIDETFKYFKSTSCQIEEHLINSFQEALNKEFERLNFAYRVIDGCVIEINSKEEIETIEEALLINSDSVKLHLKSALEKLSEGDARNSIKESVSAVEALVRSITGENTYSLKGLEKRGISVHPMIKNAMDQLYNYSCDKTVGSRHSQMDTDSPYNPTSDEAVFMLISCSSFINYLIKKQR